MQKLIEGSKAKQSKAKRGEARANHINQTLNTTQITTTHHIRLYARSQSKLSLLVFINPSRYTKILTKNPYKNILLKSHPKSHPKKPKYSIKPSKEPDNNNFSDTPSRNSDRSIRAWNHTFQTPSPTCFPHCPFIGNINYRTSYLNRIDPTKASPTKASPPWGSLKTRHEGVRRYLRWLEVWKNKTPFPQLLQQDWHFHPPIR